MSLDRDVADFLTSRTGEVAGAIERLDFIIIDFHVDPEGYREIGHMIRQGSITVEIAQSSPGSRIEAAYTAGLNKLSVPQNLNLSEIGQQIKVIHEATHALIDFHNYRTTELIDEMAAYIADSLYGAIRHQSLRSPDSRTMNILRAALEIVSHHNMVNSRGVRLSRQDPYVAQLAQAIESHPSYDGAGGRSNYANGIPIGEHGLINPWYQPRYR